MNTPNDPIQRLGAIIAMLFVVGLLMISADGQRPPIAEASGPILVGTPRLPVMVVQTVVVVATAQPTEASATQPTPEPQVVIQYVYVTADSPPVVRPLETHQHDVNVPPGAVQVYVAPAGEQPVVSSVHVSGQDGADRPARLNGETNKQVTP